MQDPRPYSAAPLNLTRGSTFREVLGSNCYFRPSVRNAFHDLIERVFYMRQNLLFDHLFQLLNDGIVWEIDLLEIGRIEVDHTVMPLSVFQRYPHLLDQRSPVFLSHYEDDRMTGVARSVVFVEAVVVIILRLFEHHVLDELNKDQRTGCRVEDLR